MGCFGLSWGVSSRGLLASHGASWGIFEGVLSGSGVHLMGLGAVSGDPVDLDAFWGCLGALGAVHGDLRDGHWTCFKRRNCKMDLGDDFQVLHVFLQRPRDKNL